VIEQLPIEEIAMSARYANFRDQVPALTEDDLRRHVPSAFQTEPHPTRSSRFVAIPTIEVILALQTEGFDVIRAIQRTNRSGHELYTKHLVTLRQRDGAMMWRSGSDIAVFEINLANANDGSSPYRLFGALWRKVCDNGLMCSADTVEHLTVKHIGDTAKNVVAASFALLSKHDAVFNTVAEWRETFLDPAERQAYAGSAHAIRFGDTKTLIQPHQLLEARRVEDHSHDLWTIFNVAQENAIKGGLLGQARDDTKGQAKKRTTRPVNALDRLVRMNTLLWGFTKCVADLKHGRTKHLAGRPLVEAIAHWRGTPTLVGPVTPQTRFRRDTP
jgi:Domain of unknown function (DUF932)